MKLYATTSSERATKGQGGNEYLNIDILNEKKEVIAEIRVTQRENDIWIGTEIGGEIETYDIPLKGNITCQNCKKQFYGLESKEDTCPKCLEELIKGKSQKGEHKHDKNCYMQCMSKFYK